MSCDVVDFRMLECVLFKAITMRTYGVVRRCIRRASTCLYQVVGRRSREPVDQETCNYQANFGRLVQIDYALLSGDPTKSGLQLAADGGPRAPSGARARLAAGLLICTDSISALGRTLLSRARCNGISTKLRETTRYPPRTSSLDS